MAQASNNKIFIIEDHHRALDIWRKKNLQNLDLVHIDAHIDFAFPEIKEPKEIIQEAKSVEELKNQLEKEILFNRFGFSKERLVNIGNYIYPAIRQGIVRDFYWVVPGGLEEFNQQIKKIKNLLKNFARQDPYAQDRPKIEDGIITAKLLGRRFFILTLESLPRLRQDILLDIDTDFLVTTSFLDSKHLSKIENRTAWILPYKLTQILKERIINPKIITIAYSVNGGFTPIRYKHFAETIAYGFSPRNFERNFKRACQTARYFNLFQTTEKPQYYHKATKLDLTYRVYDNNFGPLYLEHGRLSKAKEEFIKIKRVDPKNPYPYVGLGNIALRRKDFFRAKRHFVYALRQKRDLTPALQGLARAEFGLKNFTKAERLFIRYQKKEPLQAISHYHLAQIYEKRKDFPSAIQQYQDAIRLGYCNIDIFERLLRISKYGKPDLIEFIKISFNEFKKRLNLGNKTKAKGWQRIEKRIRIFERKLWHIK